MWGWIAGALTLYLMMALTMAIIVGKLFEQRAISDTLRNDLMHAAKISRNALLLSDVMEHWLWAGNMQGVAKTGADEDWTPRLGGDQGRKLLQMIGGDGLGMLVNAHRDLKTAMGVSDSDIFPTNCMVCNTMYNVRDMDALVKHLHTDLMQSDKVH